MIIATHLASLREPTDLALTDVALWELEEANLRAFIALRGAADNFTKEHMDACKKERPSEWVRKLVLRLQAQYEGSCNSRRLTDTVKAHEEVLRLQVYLMPGADPEIETCEDCGAPISRSGGAQFTRCFACREDRREIERENKARSRLRAKLNQQGATA